MQTHTHLKVLMWLMNFCALSYVIAATTTTTKTTHLYNHCPPVIACHSLSPVFRIEFLVFAFDMRLLIIAYN